jgi:hypothetical protein
VHPLVVKKVALETTTAEIIIVGIAEMIVHLRDVNMIIVTIIEMIIAPIAQIATKLTKTLLQVASD